MAKNEVFSKEALAKLRSPEKLDTMFHIVNPMSWITLCAIGLIAFSVLIWSIFGAFTEKVTGSGIILDPDGIVSSISMSSGRVEKLFVKSGDEVKKGDVLATIAIPEVEIAMGTSKAKMDLSGSEREVRSNYAEVESRNLQKNMMGMIVSNYDGIVEQVNVLPNMVIGSGTSVCTIRRLGGKHQLGGVFYVKADEGHKIVPGMTLQLAPSGYNADKDGQLMATVTKVSRYPVSSETVNKSLGNTTLTSAILSGTSNACLEVSFQLIIDKDSPTGYLWTSSPGPKRPISSGAMVTGFAVVDRIPPIEKVFYDIRNLLRSR